MPKGQRYVCDLYSVSMSVSTLIDFQSEDTRVCVCARVSSHSTQPALRAPGPSLMPCDAVPFFITLLLYNIFTKILNYYYLSFPFFFF